MTHDKDIAKFFGITPHTFVNWKKSKTGRKNLVAATKMYYDHVKNDKEK